MSSEFKQLLNILDRNILLRQAGSRAYSRGESYFVLNNVRTLSEREGIVTATVRGTQDYSVSLWLDNDELAYTCDCPEGAKGRFCKHCVAVGLKLLDKGGVARRKVKSTTMDDARAWLARQDKDILVDMLMSQAKDVPDFRKQLLMNAARENPFGLDIDTFRKAIDDATFMQDGYVDYRGSYEYAHGIERVLSSIHKLVEDGHATKVVELAEYALTRMENVYGMVDDSSGNVGSVMSSVQRLHHDACLAAKPDPAQLAGKLLDWEFRIEGDTFYNAAMLYADVLGDEGLEAYRELVQVEWEKVPQLNPGQEASERWGKRYKLSRVMEELARRFGGIEDRVAILSRDLSSAYCYLQIANVCKEAGDDNAALDWAERGIAAFSGRTDWRLREFAAEEYHARGRHGDAMALVWAEFSESPHLRTYQKLQSHADRTGEWSQWRPRALEGIRQLAAADKAGASKRRYSWGSAPDNSTLVDVFLWEDDVDAAWDEAQAGGCNNGLWMRLAEKREEQHPEDSLQIYQAAVEPLVQQKNSQAYTEAVDLLIKINRVMVQLNRSDEFRHYLASIRAAHKPKRNFTKMIDETQWLD